MLNVRSPELICHITGSTFEPTISHFTHPQHLVTMTLLSVSIGFFRFHVWDYPVLLSLSHLFHIAQCPSGFIQVVVNSRISFFLMKAQQYCQFLQKASPSGPSYLWSCIAFIDCDVQHNTSIYFILVFISCVSLLLHLDYKHPQKNDDKYLQTHCLTRTVLSPWWKLPKYLLIY